MATAEPPKLQRRTARYPQNLAYKYAGAGPVSTLAQVEARIKQTASLDDPAAAVAFVEATVERLTSRVKNRRTPAHARQIAARKLEVARSAQEHSVILDDGVRDQLWRAHRLHNDLVAAWHGYDTGVDHLWRSVPNVAAAMNELDVALEATRDAKQAASEAHSAARAKQTPPELQAAINAARIRHDRAKAVLKTAKAAHQESLRPMFYDNVVRTDQRYMDIFRQAGGTGKLGWATATAILNKFKIAVHQLKSNRNNFDPTSGQTWPTMRFKPWDGTGVLSVQVDRRNDKIDPSTGNVVRPGTPPRTPTQLSSGTGPYHGRLQLPPVTATPDADWAALPRSARAHIGRATIRLRVASTPERSPLWADIPVIVHRPLPDNCEVTGAELVVSRDGNRLCAAVCLSVGMNAAKPTSRTAIAAVHIGWRAMPDGSLRVGTFKIVGDHPPLTVPPHLTAQTGVKHPIGAWVTLQADGHSGEVFVPAEHRRGVEVAGRIGVDIHTDIYGSVTDARTDSTRPLTMGGVDTVRLLQSHRALRHEEAKQVVTVWLSDHPDHQDLLAYHRIDNETGEQIAVPVTVAMVKGWRSTKRMHQLIGRWTTAVAHPTGSEAHLLATLTQWATKDRHLRDFSNGLARQLVDRRADAYANVAAMLANAVGTVKVDDTNLAALPAKRRRDMIVEESLISTAAASNQQAAAPSTLREVILKTATRQGTRTQVISAKDITSIHNPCGTRLVTRPTDTRLLHCPICDTNYDQDFNAVDNILDRD